jgi:hypothetical protein
MIVRIVTEYIAVLSMENYIEPMIASDHSTTDRCVVSDILYERLMQNSVYSVKVMPAVILQSVLNISRDIQQIELLESVRIIAQLQITCFWFVTNNTA